MQAGMTRSLKETTDEGQVETGWIDIGPLGWDLLLQTRSVNRRIERIIDRVLSVQGLTLTHLEVLNQAELYAISAASVARGIGVTRQAARRSMTKLEVHGLLEPLVAESGRPIARLTPYGRDRLREGVWWIAPILDAVEGIPVEHRRGLEEALQRLDVAVASRRLTS
jgi:DNA-binding MarR family transcriptional regulator